MFTVETSTPRSDNASSCRRPRGSSPTTLTRLQRSPNRAAPAATIAPDPPISKRASSTICSTWPNLGMALPSNSRSGLQSPRTTRSRLTIVRAKVYLCTHIAGLARQSASGIAKQLLDHWLESSVDRRRRLRSTLGSRSTHASSLHFSPVSWSWLNLVGGWFAEPTCCCAAAHTNQYDSSTPTSAPRSRPETRTPALTSGPKRRPNPRIGRH